PDRLVAQFVANQTRSRARRIAFVEDEVHDRQHGPNTSGQVGFVRDSIRDPRVTDLALGAHQALRHGRLGNEERTCDLRCGQSAQESERQRDLGLHGERRMAAGEHQSQTVVAHGTLLGRFTVRLKQRRLRLPIFPGRLATEAVDGPVARRGDDPSRRARRQPIRGPPLRRRREGVLNRILGDIDVTEDPDQDRHGTTVFRAEHTLDLRCRDSRHAYGQSSVSSWNGRTSTGTAHACVALRPHSSAASRSWALMTQKPPICSLPSANGPSMVSTSPLWTRRTVAVLEGCRPPANTQAPAAFICWFRASTSRPAFSWTSGARASPSG